QPPVHHNLKPIDDVEDHSDSYLSHLPPILSPPIHKPQPDPPSHKPSPDPPSHKPPSHQSTPTVVVAAKPKPTKKPLYYVVVYEPCYQTTHGHKQLTYHPTVKPIYTVAKPAI